MEKLFSKLLGLGVLALLLGACGGIPAAYQGQFQDESLGAQLKLGGAEGTFTEPSGMIIKTPAMALSFEALMKGKPGIYLRKNPMREDLIDIYWVQPQFSSKQEAGGLVWYPAEVYYTLVSKNQKEKVSSIKMVHSETGMITLEPATKSWQVGWPASPVEYNLRRIK
jgi:hypothetical protein